MELLWWKLPQLWMCTYVKSQSPTLSMIQPVSNAHVMLMSVDCGPHTPVVYHPLTHSQPLPSNLITFCCIGLYQSVVWSVWSDCSYCTCVETVVSLADRGVVIALVTVCSGSTGPHFHVTTCCCSIEFPIFNLSFLIGCSFTIAY